MNLKQRLARLEKQIGHDRVCDLLVVNIATMDRVKDNGDGTAQINETTAGDEFSRYRVDQVVDLDYGFVAYLPGDASPTPPYRRKYDHTIILKAIEQDRAAFQFVMTTEDLERLVDVCQE